MSGEAILPMWTGSVLVHIRAALDRKHKNPSSGGLQKKKTKAMFCRVLDQQMNSRTETGPSCRTQWTSWPSLALRWLQCPVGFVPRGLVGCCLAALIMFCWQIVKTEKQSCDTIKTEQSWSASSVYRKGRVVCWQRWSWFDLWPGHPLKAKVLQIC